MSDEQQKGGSTAENVTDDAVEGAKPDAESTGGGATGTTESGTKPAGTGRAESRAAANETTQVIEQPQATAPLRAPRPPGEGMRLVRKGLGLLASLVKLVGLIAALILVVHIVFVVAHANPANPLTGFIDRWAQRLTLGLENLFQLTDPTLAVLVNYGVPALVWLIASAIVASVLRKI